MTTETLDLFAAPETVSEPVKAPDVVASQQPTGVKKQLLDLLREQGSQPISKVRDNLIAFGGPEMYACQVWEVLEALENQGLVRTDFGSGELVYHLNG